MPGNLWRTFDGLARTIPDHPALITADRTISYAELHGIALGQAGDLARRGFGPGDRCLFWAANAPELAGAILAVWRLGGIIALVNDEAPASHFRHAAAKVAPRIAMVEPRHVETAGALHDTQIVAVGPAECDGPVALPEAATHDQEPASILFTSGSSGPPKGVVQSHSNLLAGARMVAEQLGIGAQDRIACPIPWSFDYGYGQLLSTLLLGVAQVLPANRSAFALCEAIERHRPTILAGLPSIFALLFRGVSPVRETDLGSLRLVTNTGGKIAPAIFEELSALFAHCDISLNYGMTETYRGAGLPFALARTRPGSVGHAYPGVALTVLREDGTEAAAGEIGEIVHRGNGVFMGYWGDPEATARARRPDPLWPHAGVEAPMAVFSGDLGWKDQDGLLYIKGRRDRQIKSMGVRVSPDEIEAMIREGGKVRDVAIVGIPHEIIGEMVAALVLAPEDGSDPLPALKAFARGSMSQFMQPREYRLVEAFPLTPNGKPDYAAIRQLFGATP